MGLLCIKVTKEQKVFLTDSNGKEMIITAERQSNNQVLLRFNGPKEIVIERGKLRDNLTLNTLEVK